MANRWETVKAWILPSEELPLEQQFFQGLCFLGGVLALFVVVPVNLLQNLDPLVNQAVSALGLLCLACFSAARRGHYLPKTVFFALMICLDLIWFANGGSQGSIGFYYFSAVLFMVVFFRGVLRWLMVGIVVANVIGLHLAEWAWPDLAHPFHNPLDRLLDLITGYILSILTCVLMLWVVLKGFYRERRRLQESLGSLRASEEKFERIFQGSPGGLVIQERGTGRILEASEGFERLCGFSRVEALGQDFTELGLWQDPADGPRLRQEMARSDSFQGFQAQLVRKDGSGFWGELAHTPLQFGGKACVLATIHDISERRTAEAALQESLTERLRIEEERRQLESVVHQAQKMESLGSLAGGVAHDFNNMLGGIMGYADLLLADEHDPKRQGYLKAVLGAAARSGELTRKLLAFGRRGKNLTESVDLNAAIQDCLAMLRPSVPPHVQVELNLDPTLRVDGDPSQLHQVIVNLCINAVEAMPEQGCLRISTGSCELAEPAAQNLQLPPGTYVELKVADTGMGMTDEVRQRIFEPFYTTKTTGGSSGTGLGLSTVYGIVHGHGGRIEVTSLRGRGSAFRVLLPTGKLDLASRIREASPAQGVGRILVVEDETLLRELAGSALESLGFAVSSAENGLAGVQAFAELHTELRAVLLDLKMPTMGGREAFREMHRLDPEVPVIICTGFGENEEVQEMLSAGAAGMLSKPYRIAELGRILERLARK
ncbi:MAG: response regulator [Holophaga sp.]